MRRKDIFQAIEQERDSQDKQWGGFAHDSGHSVQDWSGFISKQVKKLENARTFDEAFERLINIAALAVAASESLDGRMP
jgi:hypothetical protein